MASAAEGAAAPAARPHPRHPRLHRLWTDLAPFPGRVALTWRISLLCALVVGVAMAYELPEAAISCYLVIFLTKPDAVQNIATAIGLIVLVTLVVIFVVFLTNLTISSPMGQILAIAVVSFVFLFIGAASQLGEIGGVIALVIAFILTLVHFGPFGDLVTLAFRYAWYMTVMPMVMIIGFNLVAGLSPVRLLREKLLQRLAVAYDALASGDPSTCGELTERLREGNEDFAKQAVFVRVLGLVGSKAAAQVARDVRASYRLMLAVAGWPADADPARRDALMRAIDAAREALAAGRAPPMPIEPDEGSEGVAGKEAYAALAILAGAPEGEVVTPPKAPFFFPDAWTNPAYQRFALKTTAAAVICYIIYSGIDWQGIHTAMITCYVAALGTTGETVHKLGLRIVGCLIGAAIGSASILFVIPSIDSVGALMVLVFFGTLAGVWVWVGNERIAYAGVQIALAFLLTVVQGFGPSLDFDAARGRIFGILLGNVVVYLIFTRVWVVSLESSARAHLKDALESLARLAALPASRRYAGIGDAAAIEVSIARCDDALELIPYEPRSVRPSEADEAALRRASDDVATLARDIYLNRDELGGVALRLKDLSARVVPAGREGADAGSSDLATPEAQVPAGLRTRIERLQATVIC